MTWIELGVSCLTILFCMGAFIIISQLRSIELKKKINSRNVTEKLNYYPVIIIGPVVIMVIIITSQVIKVKNEYIVEQNRLENHAFAKNNRKVNETKKADSIEIGRMYSKQDSLENIISYSLNELALEKTLNVEKYRVLLKKLKKEQIYNEHLLAANKKLNYSLDNLFTMNKKLNYSVDSIVATTHLPTHSIDSLRKDIVNSYFHTNNKEDIDAITVPNAISPNGDGINDFLVIQGITNFPNNKLEIIDRNSALVYEAKGYDNRTTIFDGHSSKTGKMLLPGTYFYFLDYKWGNEIKHKTGYIILKY